MAVRPNFMEQILNDFRNYSINVLIGPILDTLRALHGVSLAGSCLAICKNSAMVTLESLVNHGVNSALFVDVFLGGCLIEKIIEVELPYGATLLLNVDFVFLLTYFDEVVFEALLFL